MKRFAAITFLAVMTLLGNVTPADAQRYGYSGSSSYSNSYSSSWGRSSGSGPGGYFDQGYNNSSGQSRFNSATQGYSPYGGFSGSRNMNRGFNQSTIYSRGFSPYGGSWNNRFGNLNRLDNGNQYFNSWRW